jgi:hypothetical protein
VRPHLANLVGERLHLASTQMADISTNEVMLFQTPSQIRHVGLSQPHENLGDVLDQQQQGARSAFDDVASILVARIVKTRRRVRIHELWRCPGRRIRRVFLDAKSSQGQLDLRIALHAGRIFAIDFGLKLWLSLGRFGVHHACRRSF